MPKWLKNAVFYEIYPQSFYDTNGDGIGDIPGIIEKLDYVKELGCSALWINPCYDSPFKDAGYDVRDYKKVAPRYGTNEDLYRLFKTAHKKGIRVLLDLVPGHTSEEHEWFKASGKAERNEYSDRYIWTDCWIAGMERHPYIGGECERDGTYMLNFFKSQPALNYGFYRPKWPWQISYKDERVKKTREALWDIMCFWLDKGCDGFRVDMADSLVKDDGEGKPGTCEIWREIRKKLDKQYPEAALVSEWCNPEAAICNAGFHADFYLDHWGNGYNTLMRDYEPNGDENDNTYFKKDGNGDISRFLKEYLPRLEKIKGKGYISLITCNHDTPRPARKLDESELKLAFATILTLPGVPFIYYGDEIGMKYVENMPTKEGGYTRTGTRTPMQWDNTRNCGFSSAPAKKLYLPVDVKGTSVAKESKNKDSLFNTVKALTALKNSCKDLSADAPFEVVLGKKGKPFVYRRGRLLIVVNPADRASSVKVDICGEIGKCIYSIGNTEIKDGKINAGAQSFAVFKEDDR